MVAYVQLRTDNIPQVSQLTGKSESDLIKALIYFNDRPHVKIPVPPMTMFWRS